MSARPEGCTVPAFVDQLPAVPLTSVCAQPAGRAGGVTLTIKVFSKIVRRWYPGASQPLWVRVKFCVCGLVLPVVTGAVSVS